MFYGYSLVDKLFQGIDADLQMTDTVVFAYHLVGCLRFHTVR